MININLDHVNIPDSLSAVVEKSIQRAKVQEVIEKRIHGYLKATVLAMLCFALAITTMNLRAATVFAEPTVPTITYVANQSFSALYQKAYAYLPQLVVIESGYFSNDILIASSESNGLKITLINYYIDRNGACFEYIITGMDLDAFCNDFVLASKRELTMISADGETQIWTETQDLETRIQSRIFPGGRFYHDEKNDVHEYVPGIDFGRNTAFRKVGENTYNLIDIIRFDKPIVVGDEVELYFNDLIFIWNTDPNTYTDPIYEKVEGEWSFKIVVNERFKNIQRFEYEVINADAAIKKGITLESIAIDPLVTKLVFSVDYSKNDIADPNNITIVSEPQYVYKINLMNFTDAVRISFDDQSYGFYQAKRINQENGIDFYELETFSLYFKDIDSFNIVITERNGEVTVLEIVRR